ncbi:hypothetical protein [Hydrogenophaga sp. PML113]|nr:hypothetical protein [Hydrogenophaga sp. PML113]
MTELRTTIADDINLHEPSAAPWREKPSTGVLEAMETLFGSAA